MGNKHKCTMDASYIRPQAASSMIKTAQLYPAYLSGKEAAGIRLSEKALKVLRLQAKGLSVHQIAEEMGLSRGGTKYYIQETYKKLGVSTQAAAINEARNRKLT